MVPDLNQPLSELLVSGRKCSAVMVLHFSPNILNLFHIWAVSMTWSSVLHENANVFWNHSFIFGKINLCRTSFGTVPFTACNGPVPFQEVTLLDHDFVMVFYTLFPQQAVFLQVCTLQIDVYYPLFSVFHQRSTPLKMCTFLKQCGIVFLGHSTGS